MLGENLTLEWGYTITGDKLDEFLLTRRENSEFEEIAKYRSDGLVNVFNRRFALAKNATPAFMLIKAQWGDETKYCCKVFTHTGEKDKRCVELTILGKSLLVVSSVKELCTTLFLSSQVYVWVPANCWGNQPSKCVAMQLAA